MHNVSIIEKSLQFWLSQHPESFHHLDMERFYTFVKDVCRYSRKTRDSNWLRKEILKSGKYISQENIDRFCNLFEHLQDFYEVKPTYPYEVQKYWSKS